jgi:hypothetical protein
MAVPVVRIAGKRAVYLGVPDMDSEGDNPLDLCDVDSGIGRALVESWEWFSSKS